MLGSSQMSNENASQLACVQRIEYYSRNTLIQECKVNRHTLSAGSYYWLKMYFGHSCTLYVVLRVEICFALEYFFWWLQVIGMHFVRELVSTLSHYISVVTSLQEWMELILKLKMPLRMWEAGRNLTSFKDYTKHFLDSCWREKLFTVLQINGSIVKCELKKGRLNLFVCWCSAYKTVCN